MRAPRCGGPCLARHVASCARIHVSSGDIAMAVRYCDERLVRPSREFERLRVERASDLQIRMELDGPAADVDRRVVFAPPVADHDFRDGQRRQQRIDRDSRGRAPRALRPSGRAIRRASRGARTPSASAGLSRIVCWNSASASANRRSNRCRPCARLHRSSGVSAADGDRRARATVRNARTSRAATACRRWRGRVTRPRALRTSRKSDGHSTAARSKHSIARSKPSRVRRFQKCQPRRTSSSDRGTSSL